MSPLWGGVKRTCPVAARSSRLRHHPDRLSCRALRGIGAGISRCSQPLRVLFRACLMAQGNSVFSPAPPPDVTGRSVATPHRVVMPIYQLEDIPEEFVTPKHSTAYGRLITGTQVEVGLLRYKAGEGAKQHAHPHEQVLLVLSGKCRLTLDGKPTIIGSGMAALIPPNTPHALEVLEDAEVVSCKGVIGGVGHRI